MTPITATSGAPATTASLATATAGSGALDQAAFLKLLTTQMTTQDPFKPVDNTQMVAQMAQFSSVAGIAEMNASLKAIATQLGGGGRLGDAASWIGRSALVEGDTIMPLASGRYSGQIGLEAPADAVTLRFLDDSGAVVHTMDLGARDAGLSGFEWDGRDAAGATVATGALRVTAEYRQADGATGTAATAVWVPVTGVQSPASGAAAQLVTPLGLIAPDAAIRLG